MKPIIGVVARPSITVNKNDCLILDEYYKNAIINSGGVALMITPPQSISYISLKSNEIKPLTDLEKLDLDRILSMCDGILVPGGTRVLEYDYYICKYAMKNNIPILGICAGMQLMAKMDTEGKNELIDEENSHYKEQEYAHEVDIVKDTLLYKIIGKDKIMVNSYHKYKIPCEGLNKVCATCGDIIEAIENDNYKFYLGVQWHPERLDDENSKKIFDYFIKVSKKLH